MEAPHISYLEIQPFIVTLAGMFFGRGMTSIISTEMISITNETFRKWADFRVKLPIGSVNKKGVYIPAYVYPTVIIAILVLINGTIFSLITTQGKLSSWWIRIAVSPLLCFFIVLQSVLTSGKKKK